jgi:protein required for attachment to host cells
MTPTRTWILVAGGARARVAANEGPGKGIEQLKGADYRAKHLSSGETMADRPGRTFDSAGIGRHAMESASDPHRAAQQTSAMVVADFLNDQVQKKNFDQQIILAPPQALGDLRSVLSEPVRDGVHDACERMNRPNIGCISFSACRPAGYFDRNGVVA